MIDPIGVSQITGFLSEDFFARSGQVLDPDGVREILGSDGIPRQVKIYRAEPERLFETLTITAESVVFDQTGFAKYKISLIDDKEKQRSISKFVIDE